MNTDSRFSKVVLVKWVSVDQSTKPARLGKLINLGRFEDLTTRLLCFWLCLSTMRLWVLHVHIQSTDTGTSSMYDMVIWRGKHKSMWLYNIPTEGAYLCYPPMLRKTPVWKLINLGQFEEVGVSQTMPASLLNGLVTKARKGHFRSRRQRGQIKVF